jgi:hypothetical protein
MLTDVVIDGLAGGHDTTGSAGIPKQSTLEEDEGKRRVKRNKTQIEQDQEIAE